MDFEFDDEQRKFRQEFCQFLHAELTPVVRQQNADASDNSGYKWEFVERFRKRMGQHGFIGIGWPPEVGGGGKDMLYDLIFYEEIEYHEAPHLTPLEVHFVAASNLVAERYRPFWVLEAQVEIRGQPGRSRSSLIRALFGSGSGGGGGGGGDGEKSSAGTFVVPAFQADLNATVDLAMAMKEAIDGYLRQPIEQRSTVESACDELTRLVAAAAAQRQSVAAPAADPASATANLAAETTVQDKRMA